MTKDSGHRRTPLISRRTALVGAASLIGEPMIARAQALPKLRFTAGWSFQGNHSYMLQAQHSGYFKEEGVDVTVSRGYGGARTPIDIAAGIFDIGYGDMIATIKFMAENPKAELIVVGLVEDTSQMSLTVLADGPIKKPKDLEGHTLAANETDNGRVQFPVYARSAGIDLGKVKWTSVAPELKEPMLVQKRVDGITGNTTTVAMNLKRLGVDLPKQRIFFYRDSGLDTYSSCFIASRRVAEQNPQAMKGCVAALYRGLVEYYRDPTAALKVLATVEPLTDVQIERERVELHKKVAPFSDLWLKSGVSSIDPVRLETTIRTAEEAYNLPKGITKERIYTDAYLPPASKRMIS